MTRKMPGSLLHSPNFSFTPAEGRLITVYDLTCSGPTYGGVLVESGFESAALLPQGRCLTTWSPRIPCKYKFHGIRKSLTSTLGFFVPFIR
ncbi:hypothetical protein AVEN_108625-1 [Araneus ventricosus]|uniref:Uncharacterized protein n=1 Tax=Araneus ventricosus TaxID=182803 RepID=A0A4Y2DIQ3_ARAVE|nr:hypothetical protein AVEN_108625-1 [Araneus ventricosus]